jgi:hypothetical protein
MPDTRWKGKGEALPRRSPRKGKRGKTCGRPFKAPRPVKETKKKSVKVTATETQDSQVQEIVLVTETETEDNHVQDIVTVTETETEDSQVKLITETENDRDIESRQKAAPDMIERGADMTIESDTTGSTPDIFKSPDIVQDKVAGSMVIDTIPPFEIEARHDKRQFIYKGVSLIKETEEQDSDDDSEDNVPIASVVLKKKNSSLTREQIENCKVGPIGEKALGVTVAKQFDGVEYRGTVDSWRSARKRS